MAQKTSHALVTRRPVPSPRWFFACLVAGGCALSAKGELPEVEVTEHDIAIPAARLDADRNDLTLSVSFRQRPSRVGLQGTVLSQVEVLGIRIAATGGITDLSFLRNLRVTATSSQAMAEGGKPVEIARYEREAGNEVGPTLDLPRDPPADVTRLWQAPELIYTLEITGQLPTVAWTADIGLRFGATITY